MMMMGRGGADDPAGGSLLTEIHKKEKRLKLLIIIPAYNEDESIERVVDNLIKNYPQYDYVIINDGSTDDTRKICSRRGFNFMDLPVNTGAPPFRRYQKVGCVMQIIMVTITFSS